MELRRVYETEMAGERPQNVYHIYNADTVNIVGKENDRQINITESSIETLNVGRNEDASIENRQTKSDRVERHKGIEQLNVSEPEKDSKDLAWLVEGKIVIHKKEPLSKWNRKVFHGKQQFMPNHWREAAIKLIDHREENLRELKLLLNLHHPNVVQLFDAGEYQVGVVDYIYIVMELCGKNLQNYVDENPFDFQKSFSFSKQLTAGLSYLHKNKIAHRDLKPDNVLISFCTEFLKLSDFGISKQIPSGQSSATVTAISAGTEGYRSPETYQPNTRLSLTVDIFPYGLVIHFLFTNGKHPFGTNPNLWSFHIMTNQNRNLSLIPAFDEPYSQKKVLLLNLLHQTLQHNPHDRPTTEEIEKHPFFAETDACDIGKLNLENDGSMMNESPDHSSLAFGSLERQSLQKTEGFENSQKVDDSEHIDTQESISVASKANELRSSNSETSIIIFDRKSKHLHRWNAKHKSMMRCHEFNEEMKEKKYFTSVSIGNHVYVMTECSLYRLKYGGVTATWERMKDIDGDRHGSLPPAVVVSGSIYVVGQGGQGWIKSESMWKGGGRSKSVSKYNPSLNQWEKLGDKGLKTNYSTIIASKGFVYSIAGEVEGLQGLKQKGGRDASRRVERLNVVSQTWDEVAPMNEMRYKASAVECNENIIVAGGADSEGRLVSVEKYDPHVNQWTIMKPMIKSRSRFRLHLIEGNIFAVGGDEKGKTIEKLDSLNNQWELVDCGSEMKICESVTV